MTTALPERPAVTAPPDASVPLHAGADMPDARSGLMAGRTVLITDGTSGIGRATATGLAAMGARLAITGRDPERTEQAAREIRAAGGQVGVFIADLSSQTEVRRLAGATTWKFSPTATLLKARARMNA
jgi:NADP-dependent 3-hydroxy acid dehydrogenase YdfG